MSYPCSIGRDKVLNRIQPAGSIGNGGTIEICRGTGVRQGAGERGRGRGDFEGEAGDARREGESQLRDRSRSGSRTVDPPPPGRAVPGRSSDRRGVRGRGGGGPRRWSIDPIDGTGNLVH